MSEYVKIPKNIKLGGISVEIKTVDRCDNNAAGEECLAAGYIEIADKFFKNDTQCESSKINTFYHELTHAILDCMGENELSTNEKFVNCFAGFLTDAMKNAYFIKDEQ